MSCDERDERCAVMQCFDDASGEKWSYDGNISGRTCVASGRCTSAVLCPQGYAGAACWREGLNDVDLKKNVLSQVNDAGESPLMSTAGRAEPTRWIQFAAAAPAFACSAQRP